MSSTAFIDKLYSINFFIISILFLFQFIKIIYNRNARDISLILFFGMALLQLLTITYGYVHHDFLLYYGAELCFFMNLCLVSSIIYFKHQENLSYLHKNKIKNSSEPDLEEIVNLIPANVYWLDRNGIFLGCNNEMLSNLGLKSIDEYRGKTYEDLYENHHIQIIKATDQKVMQTNTAITTEETAFPYKVYLTNKIPLHDRTGRVIGLLGVSLNITQQKQTELALEHAKMKAEVANISKTEFLYNMRHDIRTPLSNIIGLSKFLQEMELNPTKKDVVNDVVTSSESLMDLLNEMLEFSNIDEGIYPLKTLRFNLEDTLLRIQTLMSAAISNKGLDFTINYPENLPKVILGDPMRTHRILLNLVANAVKYTLSGKISISVNIHNESTRTWHMKITIQDTGIGIPNDKLDFVFGRFNKLNSTYSGTDAGTGLGLAIVKEFLSDMDGEIYVESKLNQGSKFTCIIPYFKPLEKNEFVKLGENLHEDMSKEFINRGQ